MKRFPLFALLVSVIFVSGCARPSWLGGPKKVEPTQTVATEIPAVVPQKTDVAAAFASAMPPVRSGEITVKFHGYVGEKDECLSCPGKAKPKPEIVKVIVERPSPPTPAAIPTATFEPPAPPKDYGQVHYTTSVVHMDTYCCGICHEAGREVCFDTKEERDEHIRTSHPFPGTRTSESTPPPPPDDSVTSDPPPPPPSDNRRDGDGEAKYCPRERPFACGVCRDEGREGACFSSEEERKDHFRREHPPSRHRR